MHIILLLVILAVVVRYLYRKQSGPGPDVYFAVSQVNESILFNDEHNDGDWFKCEYKSPRIPKEEGKFIASLSQSYDLDRIDFQAFPDLKGSKIILAAKGCEADKFVENVSSAT